MSGIYINGLSMPRKTGIVSIVLSGDRSALLCEDGAYSEIKAIPVPDHGRLIDADALPTYDKPIGKMMMFGGEYVYTQTAIDRAPTIIPADKEGEERLVQKTQQPPSNADRIRVMADVGLAAWYCHDRDCRGCEFGATDGCHILDWLKAPVEVDE